MSLALRLLGLDRDRWARVGPASIWSAALLVGAASVVLSWNRFGGLIVDSPRAFLRMTLIGVYGWLALGVGIWLIATRLGRGPTASADTTGAAVLQATIAAVGLAHMPLLVLGLVVFAAAGVLQLLGPGLTTAVFALGVWFPATLTAATSHALRLRPLRAAAAVVAPYLIWLAVFGRYLLARIEHLL